MDSLFSILSPLWPSATIDSVCRRLIRAVLNRTLAPYLVEKLSREQIDYELVDNSSVVATIHDLEFDPDVISTLLADSSLELVSGKIERLETSIPYSALLESCTKVKVAGLRLEVRPKPTTSAEDAGSGYYTNRDSDVMSLSSSVSSVDHWVDDLQPSAPLESEEGLKDLEYAIQTVFANIAGDIEDIEATFHIDAERSICLVVDKLEVQDTTSEYFAPNDETDFDAVTASTRQQRAVICDWRILTRGWGLQSQAGGEKTSYELVSSSGCDDQVVLTTREHPAAGEASTSIEVSIRNVSMKVQPSDLKTLLEIPNLFPRDDGLPKQASNNLELQLSLLDTNAIIFLDDRTPKDRNSLDRGDVDTNTKKFDCIHVKMSHTTVWYTSASTESSGRIKMNSQHLSASETFYPLFIEQPPNILSSIVAGAGGWPNNGHTRPGPGEWAFPPEPEINRDPDLLLSLEIEFDQLGGLTSIHADFSDLVLFYDPTLLDRLCCYMDVLTEETDNKEGVEFDSNTSSRATVQTIPRIIIDCQLLRLVIAVPVPNFGGTGATGRPKRAQLRKGQIWADIYGCHLLSGSAIEMSDERDSSIGIVDGQFKSAVMYLVDSPGDPGAVVIGTVSYNRISQEQMSSIRVLMRSVPDVANADDNEDAASPFGSKVTLNESGEQTINAPNLTETETLISKTSKFAEFNVILNLPLVHARISADQYKEIMLLVDDISFCWDLIMPDSTDIESDSDSDFDGENEALQSRLSVANVIPKMSTASIEIRVGHASFAMDLATQDERLENLLPQDFLEFTLEDNLLYVVTGFGGQESKMIVLHSQDATLHEKRMTDTSKVLVLERMNYNFDDDYATDDRRGTSQQKEPAMLSFCMTSDLSIIDNNKLLKVALNLSSSRMYHRMFPMGQNWILRTIDWSDSPELVRPPQMRLPTVLTQLYLHFWDAGIIYKPAKLLECRSEVLMHHCLINSNIVARDPNMIANNSDDLILNFFVEHFAVYLVDRLYRKEIEFSTRHPINRGLVKVMGDSRLEVCVRAFDLGTEVDVNGNDQLSVTTRCDSFFTFTDILEHYLFGKDLINNSNSEEGKDGNVTDDNIETASFSEAESFVSCVNSNQGDDLLPLPHQDHASLISDRLLQDYDELSYFEDQLSAIDDSATVTIPIDTSEYINRQDSGDNEEKHDINNSFESRRHTLGSVETAEPSRLNLLESIHEAIHGVDFNAPPASTTSDVRGMTVRNIQEDASERVVRDLAEAMEENCNNSPPTTRPHSGLIDFGNGSLEFDWEYYSSRVTPNQVVDNRGYAISELDDGAVHCFDVPTKSKSVANYFTVSNRKSIMGEKDSTAIFPEPVFRVKISDLNVSLELYRGRDWPGTDDPDMASPTAVNFDDDANEAIILQAQGLNISFSEFGVDEPFAMHLSLVAHQIEILDRLVKTTGINKLLTDFKSDSMPREHFSNMFELDWISIRTPEMEHGIDEEVILRVKILPVCLNIDQDAMLFLAKFLNYAPDVTNIGDDYSDEVQEPTTNEAEKSPPIYFKICEICQINARVDYEPKSCDYFNLLFQQDLIQLTGLVSLRHCQLRLGEITIKGVTGIDRLFVAAWEEWMSNFVKLHAPSVIAGVSIARPIANVLMATTNVISEPIGHYPHVMTGLATGVESGARTTAVELCNVSVILATTLKTVLELADSAVTYEDVRDLDFETRTRLSQQPADVSEGMVAARDAIFAAVHDSYKRVFERPVQNSQNSRFGKASVLARMIGATPSAGLRPVIGFCEAASLSIQSVRNSLNPDVRRDLIEKWR